MTMIVTGAILFPGREIKISKARGNIRYPYLLTVEKNKIQFNHRTSAILPPRRDLSQCHPWIKRRYVACLSDLLSWQPQSPMLQQTQIEIKKKK